MPRSEQIPGEQFQAGDRVRCLILDVRDVGNQVKIVLSRGHPDFIKRLFEIEVPEVSDRTIEVKAMHAKPDTAPRWQSHPSTARWTPSALRRRRGNRIKHRR